MPVPSAFDDLPVLGKMPSARATAKLRELGDIETAEVVETTLRRAPSAHKHFSALDSLFKPKPWQHTAHAFGFLPVSAPGKDQSDIFHAGNMASDATLKNARLKISLNRLRVASYPGGGIHRILFDFYFDCVMHLTGSKLFCR